MREIKKKQLLRNKRLSRRVTFQCLCSYHLLSFLTNKTTKKKPFNTMALTFLKSIFLQSFHSHATKQHSIEPIGNKSPTKRQTDVKLGTTSTKQMCSTQARTHSTKCCRVRKICQRLRTDCIRYCTVFKTKLSSCKQSSSARR